ncbi:hypothetical protein TNCV_951521 [Trichonephila clavipes]|nr:hypothetical protein TNCV_951521 [Trichonephila clavipes]
MAIFVIFYGTLTFADIKNAGNAKKLKTLDLSGFQSGQIVGACLAGASVTKTSQPLGISGSTVSVMTVNAQRGKISSTKQNSGRKWKLSE